MIEIKIKNFSGTDDDIKKLKKLYKDSLRHDPLWHFMWEGSWALIRVSTLEMAAVVTESFQEDNIVHVKDWRDNIPITREHQDAYAHIFHGISEIAIQTMGTKRSVYLQKLDRITHIACNNFRTKGRARSLLNFFGYNAWSEVLWEPIVLHALASQRAFTIGDIWRRGEEVK